MHKNQSIFSVTDSVARFLSLAKVIHTHTHTHTHKAGYDDRDDGGYAADYHGKRAEPLVLLLAIANW